MNPLKVTIKLLKNQLPKSCQTLRNYFPLITKHLNEDDINSLNIIFADKNPEDMIEYNDKNGI